jgi:hypothetical protein
MSQNDSAISIGRSAGQTNQGTSSIAIGNAAGQGTQGFNSIAIGATFSATQGAPGFSSQKEHAIAIGTAAGSSGTSNVNTVTIDGTTNAFGVYKLDLFLNYTSAGGGQFTIKACVSTTSATLATPVIFKDTVPPSNDGIFLSTTISAYTSTPFYIVVNGGGGTGTVRTTGTDTSSIILTRIG